MIYFDKDKKAYSYKIENPIATVSDEIWMKYANTDKWDIKQGKLVDISMTSEYIEQKEQEHIKTLSMTKLDFVNSLDEYGITYYDHILPLLNANLEAKKQWDLCNHVVRANPLLDELGQELNLTSEQLDEIFKKRGQ